MFIFALYGFFFSANTTQSYYFELEVESSAFGSFSLLLGNITVLTVGNATVSSITITTGN